MSSQGDSSGDFLPADAGVRRAQGAVLGSKNGHSHYLGHGELPRVETGGRREKVSLGLRNRLRSDFL